ncbi:MAG: DUF3575 domain-containing protein [Bacteroidales bacterium]|nr:DUF3575 domain-containing protein [Bacteroidales bacterium]
MKARIIAILIAALISVGTLGAQNRWALKTNVLHDATMSVNLAVEWGFAPHWSAEVSGSVNWWQPAEMSLQHVLVQPELRYWFCDRFSGWFVDAHAIGGYTPSVGGFWDFSQYYEKFPNLKTFYLQNAKMLGGGVGFGYDFIISRHWNLELEMGLGYMFVKGDEYSDGVRILQGSKFDYVGPTRLAVTFSYLF